MMWFNSNMMKANPEKFQIMFLCPPRCIDPLPEIFVVSDIDINRQHTAKLLGILLDDKLKFDNHVTILCTKASRQLGALLRIKHLIGLQQRILIYQCFILSNFNFCPLVWHLCSIKSMRKIDEIQERALRFLLNDTKSDYNMLLSISGFETLHLKRIHMFALEVFKCLYDFNPSFMSSTFNIKNVPHDFRDNKILTLPNFKGISYGKYSFKYYGAHVWNHIPAEIKATNNITTHLEQKVLSGSFKGSLEWYCGGTPKMVLSGTLYYGSLERTPKGSLK